MQEDDKKILNYQSAGFSKNATEREEQKEIGVVTPEERDAIRLLFERKNGLIELSKSLSNLSSTELENNGLYNKIVIDLGKTNVQFQQWWDTTSRKYKWVSKPEHKWEIDFDTCKIYLKKQ